MTRERKWNKNPIGLGSWKQYGDLESDEPEVPPESPGPAPEQMVTITLSARCVAELVNLARNINVAFPLPEVPDA
jgi:hypothetical protein